VSKWVDSWVVTDEFWRRVDPVVSQRTPAQGRSQYLESPRCAV